MFLDKLWIRIRGELLTLTEDLSTGQDVRDKAEALLATLERRVRGEDAETVPDRTGEGASTTQRAGAVAGAEPASLEEIEQQLEELKRRKDDLTRPGTQSDQTPPNPRKLG